jgi:hypothetical protein
MIGQDGTRRNNGYLDNESIYSVSMNPGNVLYARRNLKLQVAPSRGHVGRRSQLQRLEHGASESLGDIYDQPPVVVLVLVSGEVGPTPAHGKPC